MSEALLRDRIKGLDLVTLLVKAILGWPAYTAQTLIEFPESSADAEEAVRTWASRQIVNSLKKYEVELTVCSHYYAADWLRHKPRKNDQAQRITIESLARASCAGKITAIILDGQRSRHILYAQAERSKEHKERLEWHWDLWNMNTFLLVCSHSSPDTRALAQDAASFID